MHLQQRGKNAGSLSVGDVVVSQAAEQNHLRGVTNRNRVFPFDSRLTTFAFLPQALLNEWMLISTLPLVKLGKACRQCLRCLDVSFGVGLSSFERSSGKNGEPVALSSRTLMI